MDLGLKNKVVLITGAGRGIGRGEAEALAAEGAIIVVNDVDIDPAEATAEHLRASGVQALAIAADVTNPTAVVGMVESAKQAFGRIDVLVNNAGLGGKYLGRAVTEMSFEDWDIMIRSHMYSTFLCTQAVAPIMQSNKFGRIINTSSMNYTGGGRPGVSGYAAAKAGISGFTRTTAKELGPHGITVNAIAPGYVETELVNAFTQETWDRINSQNPTGRCCTVEELGALVAFLASDKAGFINGALVCIDGGRREFVWN